MKTSVTIQGRSYDLYPSGYDLTRVGTVIGFTHSDYQTALFAEGLVNFNPVEANELSSCFHQRDQILDIQKQLESGQLTVVEFIDEDNKRLGDAGYNWLEAPSDIEHNQPRANAYASKPSAYAQSPFKYSITPKEKPNHKLVIEIAGRDFSNKQSIVLNKHKEDIACQQYAVNDHLYSHRSLVTFNNLKPSSRSFGVAITMTGEPSPLVLPLSKQAKPCKDSTAKQEWDNLIIPIKPMGYLSAKKDKKNAGLLRNGWLYVFWQGLLWRELEVKDNSALRDVRVEWYRRQYGFGLHQSDDAREAEGHWLTNIWVPYKLENEYQLKRKGVRIAFSETQWSWDKIEAIESDSEQLLSKTSSVDAVKQYSKDQSFESLDGDMSSMGTILRTENSLDQRVVDGERKHKIPVIFLNAATNTLSFLFELDPFDTDDRDDLITLQTVDQSWSQTIQVQDAQIYRPNWVLLEYSGMPKEGLLSMVQDPNDGEPAFYLFQKLTYQQVIELTKSANTYPEECDLEDHQKNDL